MLPCSLDRNALYLLPGQKICRTHNSVTENTADKICTRAQDKCELEKRHVLYCEKHHSDTLGSIDPRNNVRTCYNYILLNEERRYKEIAAPEFQEDIPAQFNNLLSVEGGRFGAGWLFNKEKTVDFNEQYGEGPTAIEFSEVEEDEYHAVKIYKGENSLRRIAPTAKDRTILAINDRVNFKEIFKHYGWEFLENHGGVAEEEGVKAIIRRKAEYDAKKKRKKEDERLKPIMEKLMKDHPLFISYPLGKQFKLYKQYT